MSDLFEKAEKARSQSQFEKARQIYQTLLRSSLPPEEKANAFLGLADVERIRGYFSDALTHYEKAASLFAIIDPITQLDAQVGWALSARACGNHREALQKLKKALTQYRHHKDLQGQAFTLWALGGTWRIAGNMKKGLQNLLSATQLFKTMKDLEGLSYVCCALGGLYRMLGQYDLSARYYREANLRMRRRKDIFGIAYSYCGLGNVQRMAGRYQQSIPFYQKAEKLYQTIGDRVSYAYTLWSLGTTYKLLNQYPQAQHSFHQADQLFQKTGDTRGRIYTLLGQSEIEWIQGHRARGIDWWKKAQKISNQNQYRWEALHVQALEGGKVRDFKKQYQQLGSKFYPSSFPINWP